MPGSGREGDRTRGEEDKVPAPVPSQPVRREAGWGARASSLELKWRKEFVRGVVEPSAGQQGME